MKSQVALNSNEEYDKRTIPRLQLGDIFKKKKPKK